MQAINPIELGFAAVSEIQRRFYQDFPVHPMEARYGFVTPSTMKPTQVSCECHAATKHLSRSHTLSASGGRRKRCANVLWTMFRQSNALRFC